MARPKKARPTAWFGYDYPHNPDHIEFPVLTIRLEGFPALTLRANLNLRHNWVSHLTDTGCAEPINDVLSAAKMLAKIQHFAGPIPDEVSTILIHYTNQIAQLGFEVSTSQIVEITNHLTFAVEHCRRKLADEANATVN